MMKRHRTVKQRPKDPERTTEIFQQMTLAILYEEGQCQRREDHDSGCFTYLHQR